MLKSVSVDEETALNDIDKLTENISIMVERKAKAKDQDGAESEGQNCFPNNKDSYFPREIREVWKAISSIRNKVEIEDYPSLAD